MNTNKTQKSIFNNSQYVIFDLDGTLVDSYDTIVNHCVATCDYFCADSSAFDFERYRYSDLRELFSALTLQLGINKEKFKIILDKNYQKDPLKGTKVLNKGYEYLKQSTVEGYKCIVLTNKNQTIAEEICNELFGNKLIDVVIGRKDTKSIKNSNDILSYLKGIGVQTDKIRTYYGDSYTDEQCAYALNVKFIKIVNT